MTPTHTTVHAYGEEPISIVTGTLPDGTPVLRVGDCSLLLTRERFEEISDKTLRYLKLRTEAA